MEHTDLILALDRQQNKYPVELDSGHGVDCRNVPDHGRLLPMKDGIFGICGKCGYQAPLVLAVEG